MKHRTETRSGRPTTLRIARALPVPFLIAAVALCGCDLEIADPALPTFTTQAAVPIGLHELTVTELIEDQDFLHEGADSTLAFHLDGDTTTLALDFDLDVELDGVDLDVEVETLALPPLEPLDFGFALLELLPAAEFFPPGPLDVPAFDFDLASEPEPFEDIASARLTSGTLSLRLVNELPVPVSGPTVPERIDVDLVDPTSGAVIATLSFPAALAPGDTAVAEADLAGAVLGDAVAVAVRGGSPGGFAADGVDPADGMIVLAEMRDLVVDAATAAVDAQTFAHEDVIELPDDLAVESAVLASGALAFDLSSDLPVPCDVNVTFAELRDAGGSPLVVPLSLPAGGATSTTVDLAGCTIVADDGPTDVLAWSVEAVTPGSGGELVTVEAGQGLRASLAPAALSFAEVSGAIPEQVFALDPLSESIDLPDELDGLRFAAASLAVEIINRTGVGGELAAELYGVTSEGDTTQVSAVALIEADPGKDARTIITIDESNSNLADLLSTMPETFIFEGEMRIGGDGRTGTLRPGDTAQVSWRLDAPLRMIVEDSHVDREPEPLDLDDDLREQLFDHAGAAELLLEIENHFPFGVEVALLVGEDPATLLEAPATTIGPVAVPAGLVHAEDRWVDVPTVTTRTLVLSRDDVLAFAGPDAHTALVARIPGTDGEEVVVRTVDRIRVRGAITAEILIEDE